MNRCGYPQSAIASCGERRGTSISASDSDCVVCPKPRRIGLSINDQIRPSRRHINGSHQTEISDSKAGMELLDMIFSKGGYGQVASSPPFFCGSPPSRALNPLIQDLQFLNDEFSALSHACVLETSPSSARTGGSCARMKFGQKPAAVRVEGFDCLSRDRRSISAVA